jgi:hypothetical protein
VLKITLAPGIWNLLPKKNLCDSAPLCEKRNIRVRNIFSQYFSMFLRDFAAIWRDFFSISRDVPAKMTVLRVPLTFRYVPISPKIAGGVQSRRVEPGKMKRARGA